MKKWILVAISLLCLSNYALGSIYIVYPENTDAYINVANTLKQRLKEQGTVDVEILKDRDIQKATNEQDNLIVYLGKSYQDNALPTQPTLFSFTSGDLVDQQSTLPSWSAIKINQPIDRLIDTAKKTVNKSYRKTLLVVASSTNSPVINELEALKNHPDIKIIYVEKDQIAAKLIEPELPNAAAIVAIYDPAIWSGNSARWILQQAYNHKVHIIGYSKAFLKAGAMVSVYSDADQIIAATEQQITQWIKTKTLNNKIHYPEYNIEINDNIARSLNFNQQEISDIGKKP